MPTGNICRPSGNHSVVPVCFLFDKKTVWTTISYLWLCVTKTRLKAILPRPNESELPGPGSDHTGGRGGRRGSGADDPSRGGDRPRRSRPATLVRCSATINSSGVPSGERAANRVAWTRSLSCRNATGNLMYRSAC